MSQKNTEQVESVLHCCNICIYQVVFTSLKVIQFLVSEERRIKSPLQPVLRLMQGSWETAMNNAVQKRTVHQFFWIIFHTLQAVLTRVRFCYDPTMMIILNYIRYLPCTIYISSFLIVHCSTFRTLYILRASYQYPFDVCSLGCIIIFGSASRFLQWWSTLFVAIAVLSHWLCFSKFTIKWITGPFWSLYNEI